MPIAETEVTWVEEPKIGLAEQLYLPAIFAGLSTTMRHLTDTVLGKQVTAQFPEQRPKLPAVYRGAHRLNRDEDGRATYVACYMRWTACPTHSIVVVAAPSHRSDTAE